MQQHHVASTFNLHHFLHHVPAGKELALIGANHFLYELTHIEKECRTENSRVSSPESVPILLHTLYRIFISEIHEQYQAENITCIISVVQFTINCMKSNHICLYHCIYICRCPFGRNFNTQQTLRI